MSRWECVAQLTNISLQRSGEVSTGDTGSGPAKARNIDKINKHIRGGRREMG